MEAKRDADWANGREASKEADKKAKKDGTEPAERRLAGMRVAGKQSRKAEGNLKMMDIIGELTRKLVERAGI